MTRMTSESMSTLDVKTEVQTTETVPVTDTTLHEETTMLVTPADKTSERNRISTHDDGTTDVPTRGVKPDEVSKMEAMPTSQTEKMELTLTPRGTSLITKPITYDMTTQTTESAVSTAELSTISEVEYSLEGRVTEAGVDAGAEKRFTLGIAGSAVVASILFIIMTVMIILIYLYIRKRKKVSVLRRQRNASNALS